MRSFRSLAAAGLLSLTCVAQSATFSQAESLARAGRADDATAALRVLTANEPNNDRAHVLLCTVFSTLQQYDAAAHECEAAVRIKPDNSHYVLDLARVYGAKADNAGPLTGMRMVGSIRSTFEHAVQLDGKNVEALSDLGEFYVSAPSIVGGGVDKAVPLVNRLVALNPARAHRLQGMIAQKQGEAARAEAEYRSEVAVAHTPESYVDLANFWMDQKQWEKASEASREAIHVDTVHGPDTVDAAKQLFRMGRNLDVAESALRSYLNGDSMMAGIPAFAVHTLLGQVLQKRGDATGAKTEFRAALALAHNYAPAQKGASA